MITSIFDKQNGGKKIFQIKLLCCNLDQKRKILDLGEETGSGFIRRENVESGSATLSTAMLSI